jgi:lysophospholipase L1-like esterase
MSRVRLKNLLRRSAIYHYVIEVKLENFYQRHRARFIPVDPKQDALFKEQQQRDPNAEFRAAIESICTNAMAHHAIPVLLFMPTYSELADTNEPPIHQIKREVSAKLGTPFVDMTATLRPRTSDFYLEEDPVHFNVDGNQVIARQLADVMGPTVQSVNQSHQ